MSETIKVLCYKSKTLSNGEHPLMLCVCKDRKRKFQSLGISIKAELWDFKTNQPKDGSPDKPGGLSIQLCKSEKKEFYIRYSS